MVHPPRLPWPRAGAAPQLAALPGVFAALLAAAAFADGPHLPGGVAAPASLRLDECGFGTVEAEVRRIALPRAPAGPMDVWVAIARPTDDPLRGREPHVVLAWAPSGRPSQSRCIDGGPLNELGVDIVVSDVVPVLHVTQAGLLGGCVGWNRTVVFGWSVATGTFSLLASRTQPWSREQCLGDAEAAELKRLEQGAVEQSARASSALAAGEFAAAERGFREVLDRSVIERIGLGRALAGQGRFGEAEPFLLEAVVEAPDFEPAWRALAGVYDSLRTPLAQPVARRARALAGAPRR